MHNIITDCVQLKTKICIKSRQVESPARTLTCAFVDFEKQTI